MIGAFVFSVVIGVLIAFLIYLNNEPKGPNPA